ncbi:hypothetical protein pb186bvf_011303 [Paramecium bursaria]
MIVYVNVLNLCGTRIDQLNYYVRFIHLFNKYLQGNIMICDWHKYNQSLNNFLFLLEVNQYSQHNKQQK